MENEKHKFKEGDPVFIKEFTEYNSAIKKAQTSYGLISSNQPENIGNNYWVRLFHGGQVLICGDFLEPVDRTALQLLEQEHEKEKAEQMKYTRAVIDELKYTIAKLTDEVGRLSKPVLIQGEPLRCTHDWYYVGTVNAEFCNKCGESREV